MCGFAGIVSWDQRHRVHRDVLERMSARIAHRGPDDQGLWINHDADITPENPQVGLAFRRLSIIDLDPRANQPFTNGRGQWLVFNGEIYNYRELRRELEPLSPDYQWKTTGDAEVLLASYAAWGEKCVEHLNGMFAFAVWDQNKRELFLARDRMGQKPLYLAHGNGVTAFASEIGALPAEDWVRRDVEPLSLMMYLNLGFGETLGTIYAGVNKVAPGAWMHVRDAKVDEHRGYFNPNRTGVTTAPPDDRAAATARKFVEQAVHRQIVADVPLGCFLSGGVDSSIVASCMRTAASEVLTFSIGFDDPHYDETEYAAAVARHLGTRHQQFTVRPNVAEDLPRLAAVFGEPFADSSALPTHYLSRETRKHVKVALSGDGGDELFGGYDRYRAMALAQRARGLPLLLRKFVGAGARKIPAGHPKSTSARLRRFVTSIEQSPPARYASYMTLFDADTINLLLNHSGAEAATGYLAAGYQSMVDGGRDEVQAALALDRVTYLPDDLLTKVDRCSMLHALEVRSPFMDHELVSFAATLTTRQLLKGGPKRMLREAFADVLPAWVFKRKKMGFAVPIGEWFRGELRPMLRDHLFAADSFARDHFNISVVERLVDEHERERVDHSQRLYALLMLELWWKTQR